VEGLLNWLYHVFKMVPKEKSTVLVPQQPDQEAVVKKNEKEVIYVNHFFKLKLEVNVHVVLPAPTLSIN
jgi:hypothetical protein